MKNKMLWIFSLLSLLVAMIGACGSDKKEGSSQTDSFRASSACIECHAVSLVSPVTGVAIVSEWQAGAHNTKNGAGCPTCHTPNGHPSSGKLPDIPGPTVCVTCHTSVTMKTYSTHFNAKSASYLGAADMTTALTNPVMTGHTSTCFGCHNPHDVTTLLPVNQAYRQSAHGDVKDDPFSETVFIKNTSCSRCHTGTGFRYYMTTGNQVAISKTILGKYSSAKEPVTCGGCHTDYSFKRLSSDPSVTFATFSTPYKRSDSIGKNFPSNVGDTKLCIPCHGGRTGRTGGDVAAGTATTDPHYFPAAGTMYMKIGYINFTSLSTPVGTSTYGKTLIASEDIAGGVTSTHRKLGTTAINGDSHDPAFFVPGNLDSGGPCITCHMKDVNGHSLKITPTTYNNVCIHCHQSERGTPLNANNFLTVFVEENRDQMNNALALAVKLMETRYDITTQLLDIESPQEATWVKKSNPSVAADFTKDISGTTLTAKQQERLRGAAMNIMIGYHENASFVHARTYMRRLIYDAVDWLDDNQLNFSVGATALSPLGQSIKDASGAPVFGKGATAFADSSLTALAPGTTPSMTYILGFSRTTGAWTTPERP